MANLSPAMYDELVRSNPNLRQGISIAFKDGTRRISDVPLCSKVAGYHEPLVVDMGEIEDAVGARGNALEISEWRGLTIIDERQEWSRRARNNDLKGTPIVSTYSSARVPTEADWLTRFDGVILSWRPTGDSLVEVTSGPKAYLPLLEDFPRIPLTEEDFPEIPKENKNLYAPTGLYGRHDSFGLGDVDGQIRPVYVGEYTETNVEENEVTGSMFIICLNQIKAILHAYSNGVRLNEGTWNEQAIYIQKSGKTWARIMFKTNRSAEDITLDVEGHDENGDGTGPLIADPVAQVRHWLSNSIYKEMRDASAGGWHTEDEVPINAAYLDALAAWLARRVPTGYRGGHYFEATDQQYLAIDKLNAWLAAMEVKGLFTLGGEFAAGADDFDYVDPTTVPWIRRELHELRSGPLTPSYPSDGVVRHITHQGAYSYASGSYLSKLRVSSQENDLSVTDTVEGAWAPSLI